MKDILKFYLGGYKKYNTSSSSKADMLATINSITDNSSSVSNPVEAAKRIKDPNNFNNPKWY